MNDLSSPPPSNRFRAEGPRLCSSTLGIMFRVVQDAARLSTRSSLTNFAPFLKVHPRPSSSRTPRSIFFHGVPKIALSHVFLRPGQISFPFDFTMMTFPPRVFSSPLIQRITRRFAVRRSSYLKTPHPPPRSTG